MIGMKYLINRLRNISFRLKILTGFLLVSLIPLILMSTVSYRLTNQVIYRNTRDNTEVIIDRVREELESLLAESLSFADSIGTNRIILEALEGHFHPEGVQYQLNIQAGEELLNIFEYREDVFSISVIGDNGFNLHSRDFKPREEDFRKKYWYRAALQTPFPPVVYPPHKGSMVYVLEEDNFFSLALPIESPVSGARLGVGLIDLKEESLKNILTARLGETGYLFLQYNRSGFTSSSDQVPDSEYLIRLANNDRIPDDLLQKNREMVLIRDLNIPDIKLASVVSLVELTRDSRMIGSVLAVLMIISLLLSVSLASILSGSIAHPVHDLRSLMLSVEKGDLSVRMTDLPTDDLGDLGRSFNQMIQRIQNLLEEIKEDQVKLRKAELRTLQAQVNPHFLYNTLDSIIWLSREERTGDIVKMVSALTTLFRTGISRGQDIIPLREEIKHIESYLTIQEIRYENKFLYEMDIDKSVLECRIIKLVLQPIVENALYHGIKMKNGKGLISIRARKVRDFVIIEVSDNGAGMTPERFKEVQLELSGKNSSEEKTVYGIKNVHDRLKIYYGEPFGLMIHSLQGEGTTVTIKLPGEDRKNA